MITFTATTVSGVQEPQLSHSGFLWEGPHLAREEAHQRSPQEQQCEKHNPRSLSMSAPPSCLLEMNATRLSSCSAPGEDFQALEPFPERLAPSTRSPLALSHGQPSHPSYFPHSGDAIEKVTHYLCACVLLLVPATVMKVS